MKVILILSPKGGSGKSTAARNFAAIAATEGFGVQVVDVDDQGTISYWLQKREKLGDEVRAIAGRAVPLADGRKAIREAEADIVVVDTPTAIEKSPKEMKELVLASDIVIIPTQPTDDDVRSVIVVMQSVKALKKQSAFLVSRVRPRVKESEGARMKLARVNHVIGAGIPDSVEIQRAMAFGYGVVETQGRGHEEVRSAWEEIRRLLDL